jgi:hypothetical protein
MITDKAQSCSQLKGVFKIMSLDYLSNLFANLISAFAALLIGIGSMWLSKVGRKEFTQLEEALNGRIGKLEAEYEDIKDKIYAQLINLSKEIGELKGTTKD